MVEEQGSAVRLYDGEEAAARWRVVGLAEVVRRLEDASPVDRSGPRIFAIDGRGGAGKTFLAERLARAVPGSVVVHTDDIAWHHACFEWAHLLTEHILDPVRRGRPVEFRPQAWQDRGRAGAIRVPANPTAVWVEGTGIIREELRNYLEASIWIQGDVDAQARRLRDRDGDSPERQAHLAAWLAEEVPFLEREQPWRHATLVVAGPAERDHDPNTEVVIAA